MSFKNGAFWIMQGRAGGSNRTDIFYIFLKKLCCSYIKKTTFTDKFYRLTIIILGFVISK